MYTDRKENYEENIKPKLAEIAADARNGLSEQQIAENLGFKNRKTLWEYKKEFPELVEALRVGKDEADKHVENAVYKNATGYDYVDQVVASKKVVEYNEKGKKVKETVEPIIVEVNKHKPAELGASVFWLTNRKPEKWKNTQSIKHEGNIGMANLPDMSKMSKEELLGFIKLGDGDDSK